ncbi:MAG: sulfatase-like hydrolase/transferase [Sediminibacterium sp.]|nr:sulfatase-like hydrolase/transferase [Sediminibacterium sp.]
MIKSKLLNFLKNSRLNLFIALVIALLFSLLNWYITGFTLFNAFKTGDFFIILLIAFLGTCVQKRVWQISYFIFFLFLFLVEMLHWRYFGSPISPGELYKFFTDFTEATQGIGGGLWKRFVFPVTAIVILTIIILQFIKRWNQQFSSIPFIGWAPLLMIGLMSFNYSKTTTTSHTFSPEQHLVRSGIEMCGAFFGNYLPYKLSDTNTEVPDKPVPASLPSSGASIVLIIGESATSEHMSVFGYRINTTPGLLKLQQEGILFAKKSIAQASCTDVSLLSFFNLLDSVNQYQTVLNGKHLLFKLAKDQGYKTYFITAQSSDGATNYAGQMNKNYIDVFKTSKDIDPSKGSEEACMDNVLVNELQKIDLNSGKKFVVLQMYGSHELYEERYPPAFNVFPKNKYPFPQNAAYDNSLLYTDHILTELQTCIEQKSSQPTYFFYMSDHGECQGEEGEDIFGHLMFRRNVAATPLIMRSFRVPNDSVIPRIMNYPYVYSNYFLALEIARVLGYNYQYHPQNYYIINGVDLGGRDGYARVFVNDSTITDIR